MAEMALLPKQRRLTPASNAASATASASLDSFLMSALAVPNPSVSIKLSLDRILDSHSDKENLIDSAEQVASALMDAATRYARKLAAVHNLAVWPLSSDLTTKVFRMLDTESICSAAATSSLFNKCALDPSCYANIDLTNSVAYVTDIVVSTMIQRAGKNLQSIKIGNTLEKSPFTGSGFFALRLDGRAAGLLVRRLHLCNIEIDGLSKILLVCQSLVELEMIGVKIIVDSILGTICECCPSLERLFLDTGATCSQGTSDSPDYCELENLQMCPLLSSLALRGYIFDDGQLSALVKGAYDVKSLDLSFCFGFSVYFLRKLRDGGVADSLETLILRGCRDLQAEEILDFLSSVTFGGWKALSYLDISNRCGFYASRYGYGCKRKRRRWRKRCAIDVSQILQERPDIHLIANFPRELYFFSLSLSLSLL